MRTYAPADAATVLGRVLEEPSLTRGVVHHEVIPAREPSYADMPAWLDPRIVQGLANRGIERLYTHQAEAIEAVHAGEDVVVVTPTASGKTLCYALPTLQAIAQDPAARALFLFPTKALGQDQVTEFGELAASADLSIITSTYDGDTPAPDPLDRPRRRAGRRDATPTCSTRRSCRTTPSGSSCSSSSSSSSSTSYTHTEASSAATSRTYCGG